MAPRTPSSDRSPDTSRRRILGASAGLALAAPLAGMAAPAAAATTAAPLAARRDDGVDAAEAMRRLKAGNRRFREGRQRHPHESLRWRASLVEGQHPFAVVVGCADSRVPPELVFDDGLGDLFVIRAAGEVLDDAVLGSIEFAVDELSTPLVVVLGHESCGAVTAAVDVVQGGDPARGFVSRLVREIEPAVLRTRETTDEDDEAAFLSACVAEQARRVTAIMQERSQVLSEAVESHGLRIVPATYGLGDGRVRWL